MPAKVQLTGGAFQDSEGNVLANGTLIFQLSQDASVSGVGNIISGTEITILLDVNGNVDTSTPQLIWGNDQMLPVNTYYRVTGKSASGQYAWGPNNQQVVGVGTFNVGTWVPNQVVSWNPPLNSSIALQHNGVNNGSQSKLNLVAGSGISVTDDGAGDITLAAGSPSTVLTAGTVVEVAGGGAGPSTLALNLSTEGTNDWIAQSGQNTATETSIETPVGWNWKLNGTSRGRFRFWVINPNESPAGTGNAANQTASALMLTANNGDMRVPFIASPQRTVTYYAPNSGATLGVGTGAEIFGDGQLRTYKIYAYLTRKLTCQVTAHASDGTTADVSLTATETVNQGAVYAYTFQAKIPSGASVVFQAVATAVNGGDTFAAVGIQAITVF